MRSALQLKKGAVYDSQTLACGARRGGCRRRPRIHRGDGLPSLTTRTVLRLPEGGTCPYANGRLGEGEAQSFLLSCLCSFGARAGGQTDSDHGIDLFSHRGKTVASRGIPRKGKRRKYVR